MTCCIAYKIKDGIILAADSAGTDEDDNQVLRQDPKLMKIGNFMFAISGSFRLRDILMYDFIIPIKAKNETIDKYMRTKFINKFREACIKKGATKKIDEQDELLGNVIVAYEDKIYQIESDFQVGESIDNFAAIGSGCQLALGALYTLSKFEPKYFKKHVIKKTLFNILEKVSIYKASVKGPYISIDNFKDNEND